MTVSELQACNAPQVRTNSSEAAEKDADFLALRLLNKRARVNLSPQPFDLSPVKGRLSLFSTANSKGWFAAVIREESLQFSIILAPLADLHLAFAEATTDNDKTFQPQRKLPLNGFIPTTAVFACNDTRLLVGVTEGSIAVYDTANLFSPGNVAIAPSHTFPSSIGSTLLSILPNPGDIPSLVAVSRDCSQNPTDLCVELFDVQTFESAGGWRGGGSPGTTVTSISWSPKGKQLALGLQCGDIVTFSPSTMSSPKSIIPHPPRASNQSVISNVWLTSSSFFAIYGPQDNLAPDSEQSHFHVSLDSKTNTAADIKFASPYLPFPGLRPPGAFIITLRNWEPAKTLIFAGDSTSSDVGVMASLADASDEVWCNLSLEETSSPSLPLDKDMNDTVLVGLELDLTNVATFHHTAASGEELDLPPPPIIYAYVSDGTILGWNVLNIKGTPYPEIIPPTLTEPMESSTEMVMAPAVTSPSLAVQSSTSQSSQPSGFGQSSSPFGQRSAFGEPPFASQSSSVFGQSAFGHQSSKLPSTSASPSFGQTSFGQSPSTSSQLPTSMRGFGSTITSTASGSTPVTGGFGAFSAAGPTKFGQTNFGFGNPTPPVAAPPLESASSEDNMAADDAPSFGGLSLGGGLATSSVKPGDIFGNLCEHPAPVSSPSESLIKPAMGFGAFGSTEQRSAFESAQKSTQSAFGQNTLAAKPESSFGKSSFGSQSPSVFGQSTFGQPSLSAQPAFGKTGFGQVGPSAFGFNGATATAPIAASAPASGGFGAFASKSPTTFGSALSHTATPTKPVWTTGETDTIKSSAISDVFGQNSESSTGKTAAPVSAFTPKLAAPISAFAPRESLALRDESRSPSPVANAQEEPPTTPAFKSSTTAPTVGAFGQLKSSPSAFYKPASGFGVGSETSSNSAFFHPPKSVEDKPVSAFALSSTPSVTPVKATAGTPTFGSSSMPGMIAKSPFGPPAPPTPVSPSTLPASTGAFSAFSSGGGFNAFSGSGTKSFGDLLRTGGDDAKDPSKNDASVFQVADPSGNMRAVKSSSPEASSINKDAISPQVVTSAVADARNSPPPAQSVAATDIQPTTSISTRVKRDEGELAESAARVELGKTPSTVSASSASTDSFVEVSANDHEETEDEDESEDGNEDEDEEKVEDDDDTKSFISELSSQSDPSEDELPDDDAEASDEELRNPVEATEIPIPSTPIENQRSPSTTPKAETPKITLSSSPPPAQVSQFNQRISPTRDASTTPPGSPAKDILDPMSSLTTPGPTPKTPLPASSPFGLHPRPNTRPNRSSPLASAPLSSDAETSIPPASKSAPPTIPQPAAPKVPFGQWIPTPPVKVEPETDAPRPQTPPLLFGNSAVGTKPSGLASMPSLSPSTTPPATNSVGSSMSPFFSTGSSPTNSFSRGSLNPFGESQPKPSETGMVSAFSPPPFKAPPVPTGGLFGGALKPPASSPVPSPSSTAAPVPTNQPPNPEHGMQAECLYLFSSLAKELQNLTILADMTSKRTAELQKRSGFLHTTHDLSNPQKWLMSDIKNYGRVMTELQADIKALKDQRTILRRSLHEMGSHMLKAGTKKEEIVRFNRAKTDTEFAKMLKVRTLGPEYLETQTQLRRDIRAIRDRIQKLEDHLQASKKRISEFRTGKPALRAPSLDAIARTFRNIDIAIKHQSEDVNTLRTRLSKLNISDSTRGGDKSKRSFAAPKDSSSSATTSKHPSNVTPNVAITTAAALNAERSAQKLKRALLTVRKEPLLNTEALKARPSVPVSFQTPQRANPVKMEPTTPPTLFGSAQTTPGALFGATKSTSTAPFGAMPMTPVLNFPPVMPLPNWSPTPSEPEESPSHSPSRYRERTSNGTKHHQKPIALKKTVTPGTQTSPSPALAFDWGPVAVIAPMKTLSADVRQGK